MSALVFMDTETTGLSLDDDIWEFAAIRREVDGSESRTHFFLEHSVNRCSQLPQSFRDDHDARFPQDGSALKPCEAAPVIAALFYDRPHVVGAVPNFDTERVALLLRDYGYEPGWHYHLIDVENLAVGYLAGLATEDPRQQRPSLPWRSDDLSEACGITPPTTGRHTAMGDAEWARNLHDAILGRQP